MNVKDWILSNSQDNKKCRCNVITHSYYINIRNQTILKYVLYTDLPFVNTLIPQTQ